MNNEAIKSEKPMDKISKDANAEMIQLFPGVELSYLSFETAPFSLQHKHIAVEQVVQINYCQSGQMEWRMGNGNHIYLNPGDFSLHTMRSCTDSVISFPTGRYSGLTICVDIKESSARPPELLGKPDFIEETLRNKFCFNDAVAFLAGNEQTKSIFSGFYSQPESLKLMYQRLKTLELLLYLSKLEFTPGNQISAYQSEQIDIIKRIHDSLTERIGERITIGELSKQFLINPTTLKAAFKSVYGNSIAAHIKEHRMERSAELLRESDSSVAEIAQAVGYDSQSKFTAAFKAFFGILPREYRKNYRQV